MVRFLAWVGFESVEEKANGVTSLTILLLLLAAQYKGLEKMELHYHWKLTMKREAADLSCYMIPYRYLGEKK